MSRERTLGELLGLPTTEEEALPNGMTETELCAWTFRVLNPPGEDFEEFNRYSMTAAAAARALLHVERVLAEYHVRAAALRRQRGGRAVAGPRS